MHLKPERVKKVEKIPYNGYLYNLTTSSGNLFANKILVKNSGGLGTPAHERVIAGMIHRANKGVLFIDEIGNLQPQSQQELLTAMQEKKYPITGQSERSSGAMVRTEAVPCLTPDTPVHINGKYTPIGDYIENSLSKKQLVRIGQNRTLSSPLSQNDKILSFNTQFQKDIPLVLYKTKYCGEVIEIELDDGTKIKVTPDHPLLTIKGMEKAGNLNTADNIVCYNGDEEVIFNEIDIIETYSKEQKRIAYAYLAYCKLSENMLKKDLAKLLEVDESTIRNWIKGAKPRAIKAVEYLVSKKICPLARDDLRLPLLARLSGVLFGDGGVNIRRIYFSAGLKAGNDISAFLDDAKKVFGEDIKKNCKIRKTEKGIEASINNTNLARLFIALGVPKNDKVAQPFKVPNWIHGSSVIEKEFFSSLISAELYGNIKNISNSPHFLMAKINKFEREHLAFLDEIKTFLNKNNVKTSSTKKSKEYIKTLKGEKVSAARYSFKLATSYEQLSNLLNGINITYAFDKNNSLHNIAIEGKKYHANQKRLVEAYSKIDELRRRGLTIKQITKKLKLSKNTVLARIPPTYRRYDQQFKMDVLGRVYSGWSIKDVANLYNIPIPTLRFWSKNENK